MNNPHQQLLQQIDLMLRARYPLLYIVGVEEEPIEQVLQQLTQISQTPRQLLLWDIVTSWDDNGTDKGSGVHYQELPNPQKIEIQYLYYERTCYIKYEFIHTAL